MEHQRTLKLRRDLFCPGNWEASKFRNFIGVLIGTFVKSSFQNSSPVNKNCTEKPGLSMQDDRLCRMTQRAGSTQPHHLVATICPKTNSYLPYQEARVSK